MVNLRARTLRKNMTPQEIKLWVQLRHFKPRGFHFRRQAPIGGYIVDFVEKTQKLVIEVDGSQHGFVDGLERDQKRDQCLANLGYRVLRFWNIDIDTNMDGVIDAIITGLSSPSAERGEGLSAWKDPTRHAFRVPPSPCCAWRGRLEGRLNT